MLVLNDIINDKLKQHEYMEHSQHHQPQNHTPEPVSDQYKVNLRFDPIVSKAGSKTVLSTQWQKNQELLSENSNLCTIGLCIL
jgi:hypothetical protein